MKFLRDTLKAQSLIKETIQRYGYTPEHNFYWYQYCKEPKEENVFVQFSDGSGILTTEGRNGVWYVFSMPLAEHARRIPILYEYLNYSLSLPRVKRVEIELETASRRELLSMLSPHLKSRAIIRTLTSPIMNLQTFDPHLSGRFFKSLRHAKNRFYRLHTVEVRDARACDKAELFKIVDAWRKKRIAGDKTLHDRYYHMISRGFEGILTARAFVVDEILRGINAGWTIPNSNRFYAAIGIHDYSFPDLGVVLYLEDLEWLKMHGFIEADMGGSDKNLLYFKKQFLPEIFYKTHFFSIARNISSLPARMRLPAHIR